MKKYNLCKFWSRFYSSPNRNVFFSPRVRAGGLLFEGYPRGNMWSYFRSPGNITFVTTNIVTFVGIVTYDTFVATNEERIFEDRLVAARLSVEREEKERGFIDVPSRVEEPVLGKEEQDKELAKIDDQIELLRQIEMKRAELEDRRQLDAELREAQVQLDVDTASPELTYADVTGVRKHRLMDITSQRVRMSLFQMVYSFYSYKSLLLSRPQEAAPDMDQFYAFWNEKYNTLKLDDTKVQEFKLPDWADYPNLMKSFCFLLHGRSELTRLADFETLYRSVDSYEIKRLLRLWLYDNWFQLKPSPHNDRFFQQLVRDSRGDRPLFAKYMSVVTRENQNPRALLFLPLSKQEPSVPLDTAVDLLDAASRANDKHATVKLLSMLKYNCCLERDAVYLHLTPTRANKKCYRYLSQNKRLTEIIDNIIH